MTLPQVRFFELPSEFQREVGAMIERAQAELLLFDPTYIDWPGGSTDIARACEAFLRRASGGERLRLRMIVDDNDRVVRDYPRLFGLLRDHGHAAECRQLPERYASLSETLLIADATSALRRPTATRHRGVARVLDVEYAAGLRERFMDLWDACTDRLSTTSLGL